MSSNKENEGSQQSWICRNRKWLRPVLIVSLLVYLVIIWCKNQEQSVPQYNSTDAIKSFTTGANNIIENSKEFFGTQSGGDYLLSLI
jgi:hypothetical protein